MSSSLLKKLGAQWRADVGFQQAIGRVLDGLGLDEAYIRDAKAAYGKATGRSKPKYIKDNVWGMMRLDGKSMRLIDSPVVQRLRGIKQLGLSYLVYPSAEHSRFVHSLGMAHVVSSLLDEAARRKTEEASTEGLRYVDVADFGALTRDNIVHAAILHDIGHMPFSHATEAAIEARKDLFTCGGKSAEDLARDVAITLKKSLGFAEIISLVIVLSKRFGEFYGSCIEPSGHGEHLCRIASLIAGLPPEPNLTGAADMISAATIDADKIDYISRDALACGIPVGLDTSRTLLRTGFIEVERDSLRRLKDNPQERELIFIVNASGMDTVDEMAMARAALYQRVYLHAVTRTGEAMLARALEDGGSRDALDLWAMSDDAVLSMLRSSGSASARRFGNLVRTRAFPKKACVFSASLAACHMPIEQIFRPRDSEWPAEAAALRKLTYQSRLSSLDRGAMLSRSGREIEEAVLAEARVAAAALKKCGRADLLPEQDLLTVSVIGTAFMDSVRKDGIVLQNGELLRTSEFTTVREQQDASDIFKSVGWIMCDEAWRVIVLAAARVVLGATGGTREVTLRQGQQIRIVERLTLRLDATRRRAGLAEADVRDVFDALGEAGYFDGWPRLALRSDPGGNEVRRVAALLSGFLGEAYWAVTAETVAAYVDQFPPALRTEMLEALGRIEVLTAPAMGESIHGLIRSCGTGRCDVAGLSPNSGATVRKALQAAATASPHMVVHNDIRDALAASPSDPLFLVDDNLSSGTQASAQILAWCGKPRDEWPHGLRKEAAISVTGLDEVALKALRSRPLRIAVHASHEASKDVMSHFAAEAGLRGFVGLIFERPIAGTVEFSPDLKTFLTRVGLSLVAGSTFGKKPAELDEAEMKLCKDRSFGYGGHGAMLSTNDNVPTSSVTALWCPGMFNGEPWMPLVLRQGKLKDLVLG